LFATSISFMPPNSTRFHIISLVKLSKVTPKTLYRLSKIGTSSTCYSHLDDLKANVGYQRWWLHHNSLKWIMIFGLQTLWS
jgi:hypothetical protein